MCIIHNLMLTLTCFAKRSNLVTYENVETLDFPEGLVVYKAHMYVLKIDRYRQYKELFF